MKLPLYSRVLIGVGSLATIATFFLPLWQIQLWAPQYPEGLNMKIWHNKLSGAFDIINGLNHYIGMREIKAEMFPEFRYLGILIAVFIMLGLFVAIIGKLRWLVAFTVLAYIYGILAIYDFYQWGYDYGHNLDPHAAIVVPGMTYQPPVIGYKNLLNFTAYSGPDIGGWIIILVGTLSTLLLFLIWMKHRKTMKKLAPKMAIPVLALLTLGACNSGPSKINFGSDACEHCKMTMTDERFGAEILTVKGKVFKFDDVNCLLSFIDDGKVNETDVDSIYVVDFENSERFINVTNACFLHHDQVRSPMRSDMAAFDGSQKCDSMQLVLNGAVQFSWDELKTKY